MLTRTLFLLAVPMLAALSSAPPVAQTAAPVTTIVLVRHAEAVPDAGRDPVLSEAGRTRAAALAVALEHARIAGVYSTQYQRTRLTGMPVAEAAGLQVQVRPIEGELDSYVTALVKDVLAAHAGGIIVIVGHSNTVPAMVKGFSGVDPGEIAHDSYDRMFIVTTHAPGTGRLVRARYGAGE